MDLSLVKPASIADYNLARAGVTFLPSDIVARLPAARKARWASRLSVPPAGERDNPMQERLESNNWTISGRLTATGHPILAGDPHRAQSVPSLRYIAHLDAPGWHVIGAGEPALPGISLGHNDRIAYALTIFSFADEEDLYVYDTNPANSSQYLYQGQWYKWQKKRRGTPTFGIAPESFVIFIQNHDQIANSGKGLRCHVMSGPGLYRAMTALMLLSPGTPMLFQGQEFAQDLGAILCRRRPA